MGKNIEFFHRTLGEKGKLVLIYGIENQCAQRTAGTFNESHSDEIPSHMAKIKVE